MIRRIPTILSQPIRSLTGLLIVLIATTVAASAQSYVVETIKVPQDIRLEVGGMGFWPDGTLVMCTLSVGKLTKHNKGRMKE